MNDDERHPEPELEVLWQRHLPQGVAATEYLSDDLAWRIRRELERVSSEVLAQGDLVVTISRRPNPWSQPKESL